MAFKAIGFEINGDLICAEVEYTTETKLVTKSDGITPDEYDTTYDIHIVDAYYVESGEEIPESIWEQVEKMCEILIRP
jgi:hypothetical protein